MYVYACAYIYLFMWMKEHVFHSAHVELRVQPPVPVLSFLHVLVRVTIAVMEHYDQRNLGREDLFSLIFYIIVHQLWKSRQELKQS